jgi:hypothetical protein
MVAALEDVLTPEVVRRDTFVETTFLTTLVVIVPKTLEEEWLLSCVWSGWCM